MFRDRLKRLRKASGLTQKRLGEIIGAGESTVSEWESGKRAPDIERVPQIASALGVSPKDLLDDGANSVLPLIWAVPLNNAYAASPVPTQENVCKLLDIPHVVPDALPVQVTREMIIYDYPAAAGLPLYAESDYERIEFPEEEVPTGADFGIRISGNSMAPTIADGSIVWVHKQVNIADGEIAIVTLDDGAVCKRVRCHPDGRVTSLESDNPAYKPMRGADLEGLRVVGRVLT